MAAQQTLLTYPPRREKAMADKAMELATQAEEEDKKQNWEQVLGKGPLACGHCHRQRYA